MAHEGFVFNVTAKFSGSLPAQEDVTMRVVTAEPGIRGAAIALVCLARLFKLDPVSKVVVGDPTRVVRDTEEPFWRVTAGGTELHAWPAGCVQSFQYPPPELAVPQAPSQVLRPCDCLHESEHHDPETGACLYTNLVHGPCPCAGTPQGTRRVLERCWSEHKARLRAEGYLK